jgi:HAD superfamily hydrolase (TIGR01509 family)
MPLELDRIRGLCFDIDGTLCDTDDMWMQKVEKIIQPVKKILGRQDTRSFSRRLIMAIESPGNLAYHILDRLNLDDEIGWIFNKLAKIEHDRPHNGYWIIPGVIELLHGLNPLFPMAVVSAKGERGTLAFLNQFSLQTYFKTVITAQTCRYTKPYPDPVVKAALEMGIKPEECLMIGDTTVDIRAGQAAGAQTAGLLCGFGQEEELRRAGADVILNGPSDLLGHLIR